MSQHLSQASHSTTSRIEGCRIAACAQVPEPAAKVAYAGRSFTSTRYFLGRYVRGLGSDRRNRPEANREPVPGVDGRGHHGLSDRLCFRKLHASVFINVI